MVDVTVILCTYNRCQSLAKVLDNVAAQTLPKWIEWEVIVVDNNSSDETKSVVDGFCRRYPERFRYLFESNQGLSYARNAGLRKARGEVVAFIDDDVTIEPTWLRNLTGPFRNGEWVGVGGRIVPDWPCTPPCWVPQNEWYGMAPLVIFDLGLEAVPLRDAPFGANMAFRRRLFERYGNFRTDLGRSAKNLLGNEDTEFGRRLLAAGERLKYEPTAVVHHPVTQNRLKREYFLTWWFNKGRADIRETGVAAHTKWFVSGIPLYLFRRLVVGTVRWMFALDPSRRFSRRLSVWLAAGMTVEFYRQSREVRAQTRKTPVRMNTK
jgi:glycosyltransferase involved in cell wall biosynthesis